MFGTGMVAKTCETAYADILGVEGLKIRFYNESYENSRNFAKPVLFVRLMPKQLMAKADNMLAIRMLSRDRSKMTARKLVEELDCENFQNKRRNCRSGRE